VELDFPLLWRTLAPGAPEPVPEYRFHPRRRWRFDWCFPAEQIAVELAGGGWRAGGGRHNTDRDREKINTAEAMGYHVLRFSHQALRSDPAGCIELVRAALGRVRQEGGA